MTSYWLSKQPRESVQVIPTGCGKSRDQNGLVIYMYVIYVCTHMRTSINNISTVLEISTFDLDNLISKMGISSVIAQQLCVNSLRPRQNGRHFPDNIFKCIFLNENICISLKISLKCVPEVRINNILALVQIMAWCRPGDKPSSEPMMVNLLTHICVTPSL